MEVKDVVTKRVFKIDADEVMAVFAEDMESDFLFQYRQALNHGYTKYFRESLDELRDLPIRFIETAFLSRSKNDSEPMIDFFCDKKHGWDLLGVIREELIETKKNSLDREVVIDFSQADPPFEITFKEDVIQTLLELRRT